MRFFSWGCRFGLGSGKKLVVGLSLDATLPTPTAEYVSRTSYPPTLQNLAYVGEDRGITGFGIEVYTLPNLATPTISGVIGVGVTGSTTLTGTPIVSPTLSVARLRVVTATSVGPWGPYMMHGDVSPPTFLTAGPLTGNEFVLNETFDVAVSSYTDIVLQGGADVGNYSIGPTVAGVATITRVGRAITGTENIILRGNKLNGAYADLALAVIYADVNSTGLAASLTSATGLAQGAVVTRSHTVALPAGVTAPLSITGFGSYTINGGAAKTSASPVQYVSNGDAIVFSITAASAWSTNRMQDVSLAGQTITWGAGTMANPAGVQITQASNTPTAGLATTNSSPGTSTYASVNFLDGMQGVALNNIGFRELGTPAVTIGGVAATRIAGISANDPGSGNPSTWSVWYVVGSAGAKDVVVTHTVGFGGTNIMCFTIQNYSSTVPSSVAVLPPNYNGATVATTSALTVPTDGQAVVFVSSSDAVDPTAPTAGMTLQPRSCILASHSIQSMYVTATSSTPGVTFSNGGISSIAAIAFAPA